VKNREAPPLSGSAEIVMGGGVPVAISARVHHICAGPAGSIAWYRCHLG
jgi:hypothetical protein